MAEDKRPRTAVDILTAKKAEIMKGYSELPPQEQERRDQRWLNFIEGLALIATLNALCTIHDPEPDNWGSRLGSALGRDAALLMSLGEPVPARLLEMKP